MRSNTGTFSVTVGSKLKFSEAISAGKVDLLYKT